MRRIIIGVMGPGVSATQETYELGRRLGRLIAGKGWIVLTGGRKDGVMDSACRGAKEADGLTIGIIPCRDPNYISPYVDIPIITDVGLARNNINVMSSDFVVALSADKSCGTASEIALALNHNKDVILLDCSALTFEFFATLKPEKVFAASSEAHAIEIIEGRAAARAERDGNAMHTIG